MQFIQIQISTPSKPIAQKIAKELLYLRLAACIQIIGPIESHYIWEDQIEVAGEYLCLIKAVASNYNKIECSILNLHPYKLPEIIQTNIEKGYEPYLDWISHPA